MEEESGRASWRRGHLSRDLKVKLGRRKGEKNGRNGRSEKGEGFGKGQVVQTHSSGTVSYLSTVEAERK